MYMSCFQSFYIYSFQVQTTLTVVEEERDRFMTKLLNEEKARKTLEGSLLTFPLKQNSINLCCLS